MTDNKKNKKSASKNLSGRIFLTVFLAIFLTIGCLMINSLFDESPNASNFNKDFRNYNINLQILNERQKKLAEFKVQIANDRDKMAYGLMNLDFLPQNYGMVFDFKKEQMVAMWMKDTRIPLDMIFIDKANHIVNIETTKPYSLEEIYSKAPVIRVLEINAHLAKKFGIKTGDKIVIN